MVPPVTIAVTILLLSVSSGVAAEHRGEPRLPHSSPAQAGQSAPAAGADVLAILPFDNISRAPGDDWIGAGIAETLMADLESIGGVAVVRLQAGTRALENQSDPQGSSTEATDVAAGRLVGARWVISGGYQRLGDRLRITTRVVEVATATVVHTAIVDGMVAELFVLQDRLATEVRRGVAGAGAARTVELTRAAVAPPAAPRTGDPVPAEVERAPASRSEPAEAGRSGFAAQTGPLVDGPPPPVAPDTLSRDAARRATVRAVRLTEPLRLDGTLDESIYETVPPVSGFIQQLPDEGEPTTEKTEAWIFFDARSVYVSARLWDSAPELLIANEMQRDAMQIVNNDYFSVVLDTFYDRRNGVAFTVNAIGGFLDYQITDEGNPNLDWNAIFDVRTGRFDGGWSLEMEIPFKSLRFRPGRSQVWGVQLGRRIRHKTEATFLTPVPINAVPGELRLSAAGTLVGVEVPAGNRTFEIKPFAIGSLATDVNTVPRVLNEGDGNFGFDLKYGVTESLTADFTVNTDFAQVEVDEQQVNLTRFSLFFPEKREFFLEGRGIFEFGRPAGGGVGVRRGGRGGGGPRGRADAGDVPTLFFSRRIGLNAGQTVPILGGGRLTGRAGGFSIGALNIQTDAAAAANALSTNFTVLRVKRDILRRSSIGGIFTGRSVSLAGQGSNEVYGLDTALSFFDNVNLNAYYARTRTPDLEGDSDSYQAAFSYSGDLYGFQIDHLLVGDNFNPEVGFLRRDDFRRTFTSARFSPRPVSLAAVRQFTLEASLDYIETGAGQVETRFAQARFDTEFENSDRFGVDVRQSYELLLQPFQIASDVSIPVDGYDFRDVFLSYSMGEQRRVSGTWSLQRGGFFNGNITTVGYSRGRIEITPLLSIEPGMSINHIDLPEGAFTSTLVTSRMTYTFTPRMFLGGLVQYNSASDSLSTNIRLRWEYQPGSEIFVVYNDQRDTSLRGMPLLDNRAFVVKFTRLFRF